MPEGWGLFTRSPREDLLRIFRFEDGAWRSACFTNSSYRNMFGLSRRARVVSVELSDLAGRVPRVKWSDCRGALEECLPDRARTVAVKNRGTGRYLCGEFVIESRPPIPWAWSKSRHRIHMPGRVVRIYSDCG